MTQNTEQNVRTRDEQVEALAKRLRVGFKNGIVSRSMADGYIKEAEARGAEEQRRKDAALTRAQHFLRDQAEAQDRLPERDDIKKWQEDQREFFTATILEIVTEYAAWRDKKDAEGQEPVAWLIQDKSKGKPGRAYSPDRAVTDKAHADKAARFNNSVSALHTRPANVAALEARIAELEGVNWEEQEEMRRYRNALIIICDKTSDYSISHKTARAALTREGGV